MSVKSPINPDNKLKPFLKCKDYTVSNKTFDLLLDEKSDLLITSPKPKESELYKYYKSDEYISHTDSNKSLIDKLYRAAKKITLKRKLKLIGKLTQNKKSVNILDVGCGTGDFLLTCKNYNFNIKGVEPNDKARNLAETKLKSEIFKDIFDLHNHKFDVITLWHVLEHIYDLNNYIIKLKQLLKDDGVLIIAVPNYKSYDAKYYKEFWAAYDVPRHLWHFSKKSIALLFNKFGFKVEKIIPMKLDSFYVSLLSEKYKTGKSNFIKSFFTGLFSNLSAINTKEYSSHIYILKNSK